jgi:hypothetical protein
MASPALGVAVSDRITSGVQPFAPVLLTRRNFFVRHTGSHALGKGFEKGFEKDSERFYAPQANILEGHQTMIS